MDEIRKSVDIASNRVEMLPHPLATGDTAVAGAGRINEDEVRKIEPSLCVWLQCRETGRGTSPSQEGSPRTDRQEIQISGGRARSAIHDKGNGACSRIRAVFCEGNIGYLSAWEAFRFRKDEIFCGCGKVYFPIRQIEFVLRRIALREGRPIDDRGLTLCLRIASLNTRNEYGNPENASDGDHGFIVN
jgi:hypothetical protein